MIFNRYPIFHRYHHDIPWIFHRYSMKNHRIGSAITSSQDHWQQALLTLRGLHGAALRVDRTAHNAALQGVARRAQWRRAMQMMRKQVGVGKPTKNKGKSWK